MLQTYESSRVSAEIDKYADIARSLLRDCVEEVFRPTDARDLPRLFDKLRDRIGTKNDYLTATEIDKAIGDPSIRGEEARALVALKEHFGKLSKLKDDGANSADRISKADVAAAVTDADVSASMEKTRKTVFDSRRTLFRDDQKPLESINHKAVVQAGLGNCYYFAALASLADCEPKAVRDMISTNKDGTYDVTFPGCKPVTVHGPTDAELMLFPKPTDQGVWVHVMEKAYGSYCMNDPMYRALRKLRGIEDSVIPQAHTDGGSALDAGLRILTDKKIGWSWCFKGPQMLHTDLVDAIKRKVPITADTGFSAKVEGGPAIQHVYSVLKYDENARVLTIRNPWADGVPKLKGVKDLGSGVFEIPLDTFAAHFSKCSYPK